MLYIFIVVNYNYVAFTKILHFVKDTTLVKEENSHESCPLLGSHPHTPFLFPFPGQAS